MSLLFRAAECDQQEMAELDPLLPNDSNGTPYDRAAERDPDEVTELEWAKWRQTVRRRNLGHEKLGLVAASLQSLPTVIWSSPLSAYLDFTIDEMRQLKTHGKKRVRAILGVFGDVHRLLNEIPADGHLALRLVPAFVMPVEAWVTSAQHRADVTPEELRRNLTEPLLGQLRIDVRPLVTDLAEVRLATKDERQWSVQSQAKRMGITRARVYQLLEECSRVMSVRWPEGAGRMRHLDQGWRHVGCQEATRSALRALGEVFFREETAPESNGRTVKASDEVAAETGGS